MTEQKRIIQPIDMTMARHSFNVTEKRIIYRILEQLQSKMDRNVVVADLFGADSRIMVEISSKSLLPEKSQNRSRVLLALKRLESISFEVVGKNKKGVYDTTARVIKGYKYYRNKEVIDIEIDAELKGYYLEKARGFTQYNLDVSYSSSSAYTMKIYELLSHWRNKGVMEWTISYLCDYFGTPDSYRRYSKFVEKILAPAARELNGNPKSDINFSYAGVKRGRKYIRIVFTITDTTAKDVTPQEQADGIVMSQAISAMLTRHFDLSSIELQDVAPIVNDSKYHADVFATMERVRLEIEAGKVRSPRAYLRQAILNLEI